MFIAKMSQHTNFKKLSNKNRIKSLAEIWNSYNDLQKQDWKDKAYIYNNENNLGKSKKKSNKKKSGYNIFIKNISKRNDIKKKSSKNRIKSLAKIWNSYNDLQKQDWKDKANKLNNSKKNDLTIQKGGNLKNKLNTASENYNNSKKIYSRGSPERNNSLNKLHLINKQFYNQE